MLSLLFFFLGCENRLQYEHAIVEELLQKAGATGLTFEDVTEVEDGKVVKLHIKYGELKEVPNSLCELTGLRVLWLNGLGIEKLPDSIGKLVELEELWAFENKFRYSPLVLGISKN